MPLKRAAQITLLWVLNQQDSGQLATLKLIGFFCENYDILLDIKPLLWISQVLIYSRNLIWQRLISLSALVSQQDPMGGIFIRFMPS